MKTKEHDAIILQSVSELDAQRQLAELLGESPIARDEILANLGLFLTSKNLSRLLFFYEIYRKIVPIHGVIMELGVRWGQNLALMTALRGIFEPFNRHRKVIGFDTFAGLLGVSAEDGTRARCQDGSFSVPAGYEAHLAKVLALQEAVNPISHLAKHELVKGDVIETLPAYLRRHPETIVSLAIFDLDIYRPTRVALEALLPHLCKGSILVFDELCDDLLPGETLALREVLGLRNVSVRRMPITSRVSYVEIE